MHRPKLYPPRRPLHWPAEATQMRPFLARARRGRTMLRSKSEERAMENTFFVRPRRGDDHRPNGAGLQNPTLRELEHSIRGVRLDSERGTRVLHALGRWESPLLWSASMIRPYVPPPISSLPLSRLTAVDTQNRSKIYLPITAVGWP